MRAADLRRNGNYASAEKALRDALTVKLDDNQRVMILNDLGGVYLQSG